MIYWVWLSRVKGIGVQLQRTLISHFKSPEEIYNATKEQLMEVEGFGPSRADKVLRGKSLNEARRIIRDCNKYDIGIMTLKDDIYPVYAKVVYEMPILLYYKGNPREDSIGTAVVGSRRCSREGRINAINLGQELAEKSIPVISGMAKGIDSYAHTACIKAGGYTIAVLGCGLDICYPSEHKLLMKRIEEHGMLLSEYPPGTPAEANHFPKRNRIIAAWSRTIYIPEAGQKSGALITKEYGEKYGRKIILGKIGCND